MKPLAKDPRGDTVAFRIWVSVAVTAHALRLQCSAVATGRVGTDVAAKSMPWALAAVQSQGSSACNPFAIDSTCRGICKVSLEQIPRHSLLEHARPISSCFSQ